jgi:hypothetical protein
VLQRGTEMVHCYLGLRIFIKFLGMQCCIKVWDWYVAVICGTGLVHGTAIVHYFSGLKWFCKMWDRNGSLRRWAEIAHYGTGLQ